MIESFISQTEADTLLAMPKIRINDDSHEYPGSGAQLCIPLISRDQRENFDLDIWRSGNVQLKGRYQNKSRYIIILARLDFGGQPHRNPDDTEVASPHLHLYREGFSDRWAFELPVCFTDPADLWKTLHEFMKFCNIVEPPIIARGLFV
jgi:hypothetical protein